MTAASRNIRNQQSGDMWDHIHLLRAQDKETYDTLLDELATIDPNWEEWLKQHYGKSYYEANPIIRGRIAWLKLHLNQPAVNYTPADYQEK